MAVVRSYPNGGSIARGSHGVPPTNVKRGRIAGWSSNAAARHVRWLMSIESDALMADFELWAYTLTVRDIPGDAKAFHALRRAWLQRVSRALVRPEPDDSPAPGRPDALTDAEPVRGPVGPLWCWVMEWQKRGAPHLHGVIVAPKGMQREVALLVYVAWPEVAAAWGASGRGQDVRAVDGATGWFAYLAKHIGRGKHHGQRTAMPPGWEASGRLWGHSEGWPTSETAFDVDGAAFVHLRRLVQGWALADARSERLPEVRRRRIAYLKRRRRLSKEVSSFVGMVEWIPPRVLGRMLEWVAQEGSEVVNRGTGEVL